MKREVEIPEDVEAEADGDCLIFSKGDGEVTKKFKHPLVDVTVEDGKITMESEKENKKIESVMKTFQSKIENSVEGLEEGFEYQLKIIYRHFPMEVKVEGDEVVVSNFLGEKSERRADILEGVDVQIEDEEIYVRGSDKEKVGQTAANIEQRVQAPSMRDRRVFEDGIYITKKPETEVS